MATKFNNVVAVHPNWELSEKCGVVITDTPSFSDFERAWLREPDSVQAEFGWDLPLWFTRPPKKSVECTFKQYVALVLHAANK